jgi:hypothetical protein
MSDLEQLDEAFTDYAETIGLLEGAAGDLDDWIRDRFPRRAPNELATYLDERAALDHDAVVSWAQDECDACLDRISPSLPKSIRVLMRKCWTRGFLVCNELHQNDQQEPEETTSA